MLIITMLIIIMSDIMNNILMFVIIMITLKVLDIGEVALREAVCILHDLERLRQRRDELLLRCLLESPERK